MPLGEALKEVLGTMDPSQWGSQKTQETLAEKPNTDAKTKPKSLFNFRRTGMERKV